MKVAICVVVLAVAAVYGADEKKNEKRGVLGLGYGIGAPAPVLGHGYYGHGLGLYGHGLGGLGGLGGGYYGGYGGYAGLGHGIGAPLLGHGLYGHGIASAPLLSPSLSYSAPIVSHAPLLGLGHGWH